MTELIVSVAVLTLMLLLVGEVMTLTVRSTGQAQGLASVMERLRVFETTLREDLRYVRRGESLMVIQGNVANAYWTQNGKDADNNQNPKDGYPHVLDPEREDPFAPVAANPIPMVLPRIDMLMFFTARPGRSYFHPDVTTNLQQVVVGHARLGDYVPDPQDADGDGGAYRFVPQADTFPNPSSGMPWPVSPIPAERWHLARRATLLLPPPVLDWLPQVAVLHAPTESPIGAANAGMTRRLLRGQTDVVQLFNYETQVLRPDMDANGTLPETGAYPWYLPAIFNIPGSNGAAWITPFQRSELDLSPPSQYGQRLGSYFMPNCASFKIEWCLDPKSEFVNKRLDGESEIFWIDPGDVGDVLNMPAMVGPNCFAALDRKIDEYENAPGYAPGGHPRYQALYTLLHGARGTAEAPNPPYTLAERFRDIPDWRIGHPPGPVRTNTHIFTATRKNFDGHIVPEDVFPSALRITVDVYDDEHRLERPIRHVMVVPVGE